MLPLLYFSREIIAYGKMWTKPAAMKRPPAKAFAKPSKKTDWLKRLVIMGNMAKA